MEFAAAYIFLNRVVILNDRPSFTVAPKHLTCRMFILLLNTRVLISGGNQTTGSLICKRMPLMPEPAKKRISLLP